MQQCEGCYHDNKSLHHQDPALSWLHAGMQAGKQPLMGCVLDVMFGNIQGNGTATRDINTRQWGLQHHQDCKLQTQSAVAVQAS
jgi:hypothetical protein